MESFIAKENIEKEIQHRDSTNKGLQSIHFCDQEIGQAHHFLDGTNFRVIKLFFKDLTDFSMSILYFSNSYFCELKSIRYLIDIIYCAKTVPWASRKL